MAAQIINGKIISDQIKEEIKTSVEIDFLPQNIRPGLAAILIGDDPSSHIYVESKRKACEFVGFHSEVFRFSKDFKEIELIKLIEKLNRDDKFHGILVQQPLPHHVDQEKINLSIDPAKDVDGFHPVNFGKLLAGEETFIPCTPAGILELLRRYEISTSGKHAVILGRSNIVGKPIASLLMQKSSEANATVTVCHSATENIKMHTIQADILIAAIGRPHFVTAEMVNENCTVIDVGINRVSEPTLKNKYRLVGDVKFDEVSTKVKAITPVPGGVGPMTIAMLLKNTLIAATNFYNINQNA